MAVLLVCREAGDGTSWGVGSGGGSRTLAAVKVALVEVASELRVSVSKLRCGDFDVGASPLSLPVPHDGNLAVLGTGTAAGVATAGGQDGVRSHPGWIYHALFVVVGVL